MAVVHRERTVLVTVLQREEPVLVAVAHRKEPLLGRYTSARAFDT